MNALPIDAKRVQRNFSRAATTYDEVAVLPREIASRLLDRLDGVKIAPRRILDLGCGTGAGLAGLAERYPKSPLLGADFSEPMLRVGRRKYSRLRWQWPFLKAGKTASLVAANAHALPFGAASFDFVWSNLMLHWLDEPRRFFRECGRILAVDGLLMFSAFGPDTLHELRACFPHHSTPGARFTDMHDLGDMLLECGFADPVMSMEKLTMTYASFDDLARDLRQNGGRRATPDSLRNLAGKSAWRAACAAYEAFVQGGRYPASFEVIYGHAWKPQARTVANETRIIRFDPKQRLR